MEILSVSTCRASFMFPTSTAWRDGVYYMLAQRRLDSGKGSRIGEYSSSRDWSSTRPGQFICLAAAVLHRQRPGPHGARIQHPAKRPDLYPYVNIVQVYDTKTADGVEWNMIGHGEWVEARILATVTPKHHPARRSDHRPLDRCQSGRTNSGRL